MRRRVVGGLAALLVAAGGLAAADSAYGVADGTPAADGEYAFVAHVKVGTFVRACTGALIDPEWVVTATACFSDNGQAVPAGPPALATTVTVGRTDMAAATGGVVRAVTQLVPHATRNVVLARLATPVFTVTPATISTTAPAAGESLRVAGFGRTATSWAPGRLHTTLLGVQAVADTTIDLSGPAGSGAICKGDAGGPTFRPRADGNGELVALHTSSTQSGCVGVPAGTPALAVDTRLDTIADWIGQTVRGGAFVRLPAGAAVLDTRSGIGAATGARAAGTTTRFPVTGVGGVPTSGVTAVLIDVTAITTTAATHLTVFPDGTPVNPALSMVNATAQQTISNSAVVNVPANGRLAVYTSAGGVHMTVDVQGYYTRPAGAGATYVPVTPRRLVDTRSGLGGSTGKIPAGGSRTFTLTGTPIPAGASAAFLDMIATGATAQGWIATSPTGGTSRSVMDFVVGTTAHAVSVRLTADGRASFTNGSSAPVDLVLTASGYWIAGSAGGGDLRTITAARLLDTRTVGSKAPVAANATVDVPLGLPPGSAAVVNFTLVGNTQTGYLHAWPVGGTEPTTSLINYPAVGKGPRAGMAVVEVGTGGKIRIRNVSSGTVHLLVDLQSWYAPGVGLPVRPAAVPGN